MTGQAGKKVSGGKRGERAPTSNFTMRLKPSMLADLKAHAAQNETSIAAEAERRLSQPEVNDVARMIGLAIDGVTERAGKSWRDDPYVKSRARAAAEVVLNLLLGAPLDEERLFAQVRMELETAKRFAEGRPGILSQMLGTEPLPVSEIERGLALLTSLSDDKSAVLALFPATEDKP